MTFNDLTAILEKRLRFYETLMDKMARAVRTGDTAGIEMYTELESQTGREIAALRRCFSARRGESPNEDAAGKLETLMETARTASRRTRDLLRREKAHIASRLLEIRKKTPARAFPPAPPVPALVDIQA
jgi:hypothetical protein